MKKYLIFTDGNGHELLGTDSFLPLDGRISNKKKIWDIAKQRADSLKNVKPQIAGFKIGYGSIRDNNLGRIIPLK